MVPGFLRRHPVICLLLLSPGIPEYLTSSSPLNAILLNPVMFLFQLAANLALYGPGVLLVREAMVRWRKGWGSVLLLGAAYGILEEGVALSTLFNPDAGPVGQLGTYGHWLGVSWVWLGGIIPVHMIFSISIPILLLGVAVPETRGRALLGGRKLAVAFVVLGADVSALLALVTLGEKFWMGWPIFLGSFAAIGILIFAARNAGEGAIHARTETPRVGPRRMAVVGALFFPAALLSQYIPLGAGAPPILVFLWVALVQALFLVYVLRVAGSRDNERHLVGLAIGLLVPLAVFGLLAEISLPVILVADLLMALFLRGLWRGSGKAIPVEAQGGGPTGSDAA